MSNGAEGRTLSPDGNYWWDGSTWQPVSGATADGDADAAQGSDADAAQETKVPGKRGPIILYEPADTAAVRRGSCFMPAG